MASGTLRVTRRQALGLAAGGALGAAGLRVATLHWGGSSPSAAASAAGPSGAWRSPLDDPRALSAHLLRRAGFAHTAADLDRVSSMSYTDLVDSVVSQTPDVPSSPPTNLSDYRSVSQWWFTHMATTSAQFCERMLLFWHGVLTSDYRKAARFPYIYQQNQLYRRLGTGDLRTLLVSTTYDPAMMRYLDLDQSTAAAPNENYSRELMELFTLGVGSYSEQDVREGARALSGVRIGAFDASGTGIPLPRPRGRDVASLQQYYQQLGDMVAQGTVFRGYVVPRLHDQGTKTYLGRTGNLGPEDVVDAILAKDVCATFIARKALTYFAVPQPSDALVAQVAGVFRASHYDIRALMRAVFLSDDFRAAANYRSLVRSPVDYSVALMRVLQRPDLAATAVTAGAGMDQVVYDPPTVAGWPANGGWLSSGAWLGRVNLAAAAVAAGGTLPDPAEAVRTHLDGVVGPDLARVFDASTTTSDRWYALLASPEFHLK